jgi:hypothetical protein
LIVGTSSILNFTVKSDTQKVLIGTTTEYSWQSFLSPISLSNRATTSIAGIHGEYDINPTAGGVQIGNRFVVNVKPTTNANTAVGEVVRMIDNTSLSNTVRGIEVVSSAGSNSAGINTGVRTTGATFGLQALTTGNAGGSLQPAAIYGENTNSTQGDILRLYTASMTTASSFASFFQETSAFSGIGLLMNFGKGGGSFTGNFADFKKNDVLCLRLIITES